MKLDVLGIVAKCGYIQYGVQYSPKYLANLGTHESSLRALGDWINYMNVICVFSSFKLYSMNLGTLSIHSCTTLDRLFGGALPQGFHDALYHSAIM